VKLAHSIPLFPAEEMPVITTTKDEAIFSRHFIERLGALLSALPADWDFTEWGCNFRTYRLERTRAVNSPKRARQRSRANA
jgi:hypothetical protein